MVPVFRPVSRFRPTTAWARPREASPQPHDPCKRFSLQRFLPVLHNPSDHMALAVASVVPFGGLGVGVLRAMICWNRPPSVGATDGRTPWQPLYAKGPMAIYAAGRDSREAEACRNVLVGRHCLGWKHEPVRPDKRPSPGIHRRPQRLPEGRRDEGRYQTRYYSFEEAMDKLGLD